MQGFIVILFIKSIVTSEQNNPEYDLVLVTESTVHALISRCNNGYCHNLKYYFMHSTGVI